MAPSCPTVPTMPAWSAVDVGDPEAPVELDVDVVAVAEPDLHVVGVVGVVAAARVGHPAASGGLDRGRGRLAQGRAGEGRVVVACAGAGARAGAGRGARRVVGRSSRGRGG